VSRLQYRHTLLVPLPLLSRPRIPRPALRLRALAILDRRVSLAISTPLRFMSSQMKSQKKTFPVRDSAGFNQIPLNA
jgi:hypothetical protein